MSSNLPPYSLEKSAYFDESGEWIVRVDGVRAGRARPIIRGFVRARKWEAVTSDGVPFGPRVRTRALAVALILEQWKKDHS